MASSHIRGWVLSNALGGALAVLVCGAAFALATLIPALLALFFPLVSLVSFGGIGLGLGLMQRRILRRVLPSTAGKDWAPRWMSWVSIDAAGSILPSWLLLFAGIMGGSNGGMPVSDAAGYIGGVSGAAAVFAGVSGALCGAVVGVLHALILRKQVPDARPLIAWALTTALGWGLSLAVQGGGFGLLVTSGATGESINALQAAAGSLCMLAAWGLNGLVTAPALQTLGRHAGGPASPSVTAEQPFIG